MKWALWVVGALAASVVAVIIMFVLSARAAARAIVKKSPKETAIEQKTKSDEREIDTKADAERQEVVNADVKTLVERVRARLARGLRR